MGQYFEIDADTERLTKGNFLDNYINGFNLSLNTTNPTYQIDISSGVCRNDNNDGDIRSTSTITVDITASGANGLDTGSEASNTWYYIYIIYDSTTDTTAGLISASPTSPTMPGSYTEKRYIGSIRNNGGSNFVNVIINGL